MKILGLDFDNTLVTYDKLFYNAALERSLIPENLDKNKREYQSDWIYQKRIYYNR